MLSNKAIAIVAAAAFGIAPALAWAQDAQRGQEVQPSATVADTGTGGVATVQQAQDEQDDDTTIMWAGIGLGAAALIAVPLALSGGGGDGPTQTSP